MNTLHYLNQRVNLFLPQNGQKAGIRFPSVTAFKAVSVTVSDLNKYCGTNDAIEARKIYEQEGNTERYKSIKRYCPCVQLFSSNYPSKALPRGNKQALQRQTGLFTVDVDHYSGNIDNWIALDGVIGFGRSVSGDGYFFILRTNYRFIANLQFSDWIKSEILPLFNGYADPACVDCGRLRFLGKDKIAFTGAISLIDDVVRAPNTNYRSELDPSLSCPLSSHFSFRKAELGQIAAKEDWNERHRLFYVWLLKVADDIKGGLYSVTLSDILEAGEVLWNEPLNRHEINSINNAMAKVGVTL